jgi:hypothetical protein
MPAAWVTSTYRIGPEGRAAAGGAGTFVVTGFGEGVAGLDNCCDSDCRGCACLQAVMMQKSASREKQEATGVRNDIK